MGVELTRYELVRRLAEVSHRTWIRQKVRGLQRRRGRGYALRGLEPRKNPCHPILQSAWSRTARPKNKPTGKRGPGDPGIRQGRPFTGVGEVPGPVFMTSNRAAVFPSP